MREFTRTIINSLTRRRIDSPVDEVYNGGKKIRFQKEKGSNRSLISAWNIANKLIFVYASVRDFYFRSKKEKEIFFKRESRGEGTNEEKLYKILRSVYRILLKAEAHNAETWNNNFSYTIPREN